MKTNVIKISENRYNVNYDSGCITENIILISRSDSQISSLTNDTILKASFRRSFMDKNLDNITIEVPSPQINDAEKLMKLIDEVCSSKYEIIKDTNFNMADYLNKITISLDDNSVEYEISKDSDLGKSIMELSGLSSMLVKENKEILESIEL